MVRNDELDETASWLEDGVARGSVSAARDTAVVVSSSFAPSLFRTRSTAISLIVRLLPPCFLFASPPAQLVSPS